MRNSLLVITLLVSTSASATLNTYTTSIEYLDAQNDLGTAELNLADVTAQLQHQWLELQASLGLIVGVDHG